eukprot:CAMPEP_0119097470 /NCGR_PEP_ID=MMETSP1178-20130426/178133_1 /TAXON_ID=33656 /ORGANISM="unid sp, Strain CCMP2000" /LENGTH=53 /DNA_ID=CAMNT_0007081413 /DNA_START=100 /DNA_END=257 /DNA_ORIENTATION=+
MPLPSLSRRAMPPPAAVICAGIGEISPPPEGQSDRRAVVPGTAADAGRASAAG